MEYFDQKILFERIAEKIPEYSSLANELSETLGLGIDSIYRRLRGQTKVSLEEAVKMARKYDFSLDEMYQHTHNTFPFIYRGINYNIQDLETYYNGILNEFDKAGEDIRKTKIYYATKDIPMFHIFSFPEVAALRLFFWKKTIYDLEDYKSKTFSLEEIDNPILDIGKKMTLKYMDIPSLEIWSDEVIMSTVNPVLYYYESGVIEKRNLALHLLDKIDDFLNHVRKQAELGGKFLPEQNGPSIPNNLEMYYNEVTLANNTIVLESRGQRNAYLVQRAVDYLFTDNVIFCDRAVSYIEHLTKKSVNISNQAEKFRQKFFAQMHRQVDRVRDRIR